MKEYELKYGCNPNQKPSRLYMEGGGHLPFEILSGKPGYINFLDALNGWQLVSEMKGALGIASAASFKHVSPTSAAAGLVLPQKLKQACFVEDLKGLDDSSVACAYARARGTDRMSSFGDWAALSDECDEITAKIISREVSDGIIAPKFTPKALEILKQKKNGSYAVVQIDSGYVPQNTEKRQIFGVTFEQKRNDIIIDGNILKNIVTKNKDISATAKADIIAALITLKYTQSNSVCFASGGQAIGVGAGQQSRIHCTRLAASKADLWHLRQHDKVLNLKFAKGIARSEKNNIIEAYLTQERGFDDWKTFFIEQPPIFSREEKREYLNSISGVTLASDAFFPFSDNIERAKESGVSFVAQPGGSLRDEEVISLCDKYGMVMVFTQVRLFHH